MRIMIWIKASLEDHNICAQYVTQAYIQVYDLERDLYIKPAEQFKLAPESSLSFLNLYMAYTNLDIPGSNNTRTSLKRILT